MKLGASMFSLPGETALIFRLNLIISNASVGTARLKLVGAFTNNDISTAGSYTEYDRSGLLAEEAKRMGKA
jgi:hypothetical protein